MERYGNRSEYLSIRCNSALLRFDNLGKQQITLIPDNDVLISAQAIVAAEPAQKPALSGTATGQKKCRVSWIFYNCLLIWYRLRNRLIHKDYL